MSESKEGGDDEAPLAAKISDIETLSKERAAPLSEFLKVNKDALKDMTEEEFTAAYEAQVKKSSTQMNKINSDDGDKRSEDKDELQQGESVLVGIGRDSFGKTKSTTNSSGTENVDKKDSVLNVDSIDRLSNIVLKFTTLSEASTEAPSFTVSEKGAKVGRNETNEVSVPSDARLASDGHASFVNENGIFYLYDHGYDCAASLRIGMGVNSNRKWKILNECRFSAGNSIFESKGVNIDGNLVIDVIDGPLKGEIKTIDKSGATIGRSSDNSISVPDRELSRRHSKISYDSDLDSYLIGDVGSTNGTYVQLVGPYGGRYRLHINDHILVGRTGFSVNRFDYGISEEIGHRQTMEDSCAIVQHMSINGLSITKDGKNLFPQSFFGVYDGHGGAEASAYLSRTLHVNVADSIEDIAPALNCLLAEEHKGSDSDKKNAINETNKLVIETIKSAFTSTDSSFIKTSEFAQHGSTATTVLLLGTRLYCANTGDSRTMLCRNFGALPLTTDHKPSREDEAARIRNAGGFVISNRVMGELAVSRAFGDADFKKGIQSIIDEEGGSPTEMNQNANDTQQDWDKPLIIAEPEIEVTNIRKGDQFLLLACDGLFDVFSYDEVVEFVRDNMEKHGDAQRCCQNLTFEAIRKRNSRDNVSVILIILNKWW
jgi:serine/threonine protein phosphatase PrpC